MQYGNHIYNGYATLKDIDIEIIHASPEAPPYSPITPPVTKEV